MKKLTNEQMKSIMTEMAHDILLWQNSFNGVVTELEKLDGKKRLQVRIDTEEDIVNAFISRKIYRDN